MRKKQLFKGIVFILVFNFGWASVIAVFGLAPTDSQGPYPVKTSSYWTKPTMSLGEAKNLAKHDVLIVDLENKFNNYQVLVELKRLNPQLKLFCYSNPMEIYTVKYSDRPWQNKVIDEIVDSKNAWLLKTITPVKYEGFFARLWAFITGKPKKKEGYAKFWTGMLMLNMSSSCPKIDGVTYSEWMGKKLNHEILQDTIWNGYFQDNGTGNISWTQPGIIDIDGDQDADKDLRVDRLWKEGMTNFIRAIKRAHPNLAIITNKGSLDFLDLVNGKWFEHFPNDYLGDKWADGWRQCVENAKKMGNYTVFQGNRSNINFILASALLLDNVYLAISQDDAGFFSELMFDPGQPLGPSQKKGGIYYREYEYAQIMVDPLKKIGEISPKK